MVKERPILFSAPMVRAILDGSKTQTRRLYKFRETNQIPSHPDLIYLRGFSHHCPYGAPGDRLWVREAISEVMPNAPFADKCFYRADGEPESAYFNGQWKPSIHMKRIFSRITLEITSVRLEKLHDISDTDAKAEGMSADQIMDAVKNLENPMPVSAYVGAFKQLWNKINRKTAPWSSNPWVWVIEFKKV